MAPKGVWGNGRFPQLNLPSALAVAKQGYSFFICLTGFSDCFYWGLDARFTFKKMFLIVYLIIQRNCLASRQLKNNLLLLFWQIKKLYSCGQT